MERDEAASEDQPTSVSDSQTPLSDGLGTQDTGIWPHWSYEREAKTAQTEQRRQRRAEQSAARTYPEKTPRQQVSLRVLAALLSAFAFSLVVVLGEILVVSRVSVPGVHAVVGFGIIFGAGYISVFVRGVALEVGDIDSSAPSPYPKWVQALTLLAVAALAIVMITALFGLASLTPLADVQGDYPTIRRSGE